MDYYKVVLEALYKLLNETGVKYWAEWISKDINFWIECKSVEHHLSAYGGMGSFNDVVICLQNNHKVTNEQESWTNFLLMNLQSLSVLLTESKDRIIGLEDIKNNLRSNSSKIQGARCLACGYSELSSYNVDNFIAPKIISDGIVKSLSSGNLMEFVEDVIGINLPEIEPAREEIIKIIQDSNINYTMLNRWMRPCPQCGSDDTAVYRWDRVKKMGFLFSLQEKFEPSDDNLPLR